MAIVHACVKFHDYIVGQGTVIVETDHRPLVPIFSKPLHQCPLRLQRMCLTLQRYPIKLIYKAGKELFLADALTRFPSTQLIQEETEQFQANVLEYSSASQQRLRELRAATDEDPAVVNLRGYTERSWHERNEVPESVRQYWSYKEELHTQDDLVYRSNKVIIPTSQKKQIMLLLHAAHPGVEKMKTQARDIMYWPNMSREMEQFCEKLQGLSEVSTAERQNASS